MNEQASDPEAVITEITERLEARFPHVEPARVRATVEAARDHFSRARVKDFVLLFIEREARARLERPIA